MNDKYRNILNFLEYSEGLKRELRHSWLSNGRQESSADHTWRMALIAIIIAPKTGFDFDMEKLLKMILVHDIVEIDAKDIPAFLHMNSGTLTAKKLENEQKAIKKVREILGDDGIEIEALWQEYAEKKTVESRLASYLDKIEARTQKYLQKKFSKEELDMSNINKYSELIKTLADEDEYLLDFHKAVKTEREKRIGISEDE